MGVKPELALMCAGKCMRCAGRVGDQARRLGAELEGHRQVLVAARHSPASDRVGGGFRLGGAGALDGPDWLRAW